MVEVRVRTQTVQDGLLDVKIQYYDPSKDRFGAPSGFYDCNCIQSTGSFRGLLRLHNSMLGRKARADKKVFLRPNNCALGPNRGQIPGLVRSQSSR